MQISCESKWHPFAYQNGSILHIKMEPFWNVKWLHFDSQNLCLLEGKTYAVFQTVEAGASTTEHVYNVHFVLPIGRCRL
jgi:hypothetical protein